MPPRLLAGIIALVLAASAGATAGPRGLDAHQRKIIKQFVLREAKASILAPRAGEPQAFARVLTLALREAGAWVSVDQHDSIEPGETGLMVIYDHAVPADSSIFLALQRAGLNPKEEDVPGAPVATVIVGPQS
jgi:hypothetical protein